MRFDEFTEQTVSEGLLDNPGAEDSPVASAITRRILLQRTDLLSKYGPEKVGAAVDEVADFVGDVEEIGSSDVSGWIRHVEQMLGNMGEGVAEGSEEYCDACDRVITKKPHVCPGSQGVAEGSSGRDSWDSNMPGYQGDYGGAENWGRREREDDEHHEIDRRMEQEREYRNTHGTWYVRIDGMIDPTPYQGKAAANAAGLELKKQPGNENKLFMLTAKA